MVRQQTSALLAVDKFFSFGVLTSLHIISSYVLCAMCTAV